MDRNHKFEGRQSEDGDEDEGDEDDDRNKLIDFLMLSDSVKTTELVRK